MHRPAERRPTCWTTVSGWADSSTASEALAEGESVGNNHGTSLPGEGREEG